MTKIALTSLHQRVADLISGMIRSGELRKGQKINELQLAESIGVSRTPIREALRALNTRGLIDLVPHKGAFVSRYSAKEVEDMFAVMSVLEGMSARLAIRNLSKKRLEQLETLQQKLETHYRAGNHTAYLNANQRLHAAIQQVADNTALSDVINTLRDKILLLRQKQLYEPERFKESVREHRAIMEAFRKRDSRSAEGAMKRHLLAQSKALVRIMLEETELPG